MKRMKLKYGLFITTLILLAMTSCQKVIDLKLSNAPAQIVIEGNLTDRNGPQYVTITKSVSFSSTDKFPPVSGATVVLTDDESNQFQFSEVKPGIYMLYPYRGDYGKTYTLTVKTGSVTYTAQSTMPVFAVPLDSLSDKTNLFGKNDLRTVTVYYQDPASISNQYLFSLYVNSSKVGTIFTNDDSFTNGRYVSEDLFQTDIDVHPGDTAKVSMECIDKSIYQYWYTLSQQQINGPGGGVTPSNPPSNFNNNALGYFSAHTQQSRSLIVR